MSEYKGCLYCLYFRPDGTCLAFDPDFIPVFIASGQFRHTEPLHNQRNTIVYKPAAQTIFRRLDIKNDRKQQ